MLTIKYELINDLSMGFLILAGSMSVYNWNIENMFDYAFMINIYLFLFLKYLFFYFLGVLILIPGLSVGSDESTVVKFCLFSSRASWGKFP